MSQYPNSQNLLNDPTRPVGLTDVGAPIYDPNSNIITVGVGKMFQSIGAAVAAAHNGSVILVDAGTYTNDWVHSTAAITVIGVGGMVNMVATTYCADHKAIWTSDNDLNLQNFTFSGAAVSAADGGNGAGIRYEAGKLQLTNDAFYNNQNGIMGGAGVPGLAGVTEIDINHSVFSGNGSGSGNTHNIYVGAIQTLNVTNSIFENANVGHELKSRALVNNISNNLFYDGPTGTASYDIDLPNGGVDTVTNNVIEKGPLAQNNAMVHYGGEGLPYANSSLVLSGNTFVNDKGSVAIGVLNQSGLPITIEDNTFVNVAAARIAQGPATITGNVDGSGHAIADSTTTDAIPGSTVTYTDSADHSITLGGSTLAVRGGAGKLTVSATVGHVVAIGGSGGLAFSETPNSGANQITTAAGSTNTLQLTGGDTVNSQGNDTITSDNQNTTGTISGNAYVSTSVYDAWTIKGTATINGRAAASPWLTLMSGAQTSINGQLYGLHVTSIGGSVSLDANQASSTGVKGAHMSWSVSGGSFSAVYWQGVTQIQTSAGQSSNVHLGDGTTQLTSLGNDQIWAGAGDATVILGGGGNVLYAGTGNLSIYGRSLPKTNQAKVYGNGGTYNFGGDTGNIIYYGGDKASTVNLNLSFLTLYGGAGKLTVSGGTAETIYGGSGGVDYTAGSNGNAHIVTAAGSTNVLRLAMGGGVESWGNDTIIGGTANDAIVVHGNATISGGTGNRNITLMGNDTFTHNGNATVTVTQGANVNLNVSYGTITETQATVNFVSPNGASGTVVGGGATIYTRATTAEVDTTAKNSTSVTFSGDGKVVTNGTDTVHAGSGTETVQVNVSGSTIFGGSGSLSVTGSASGMKFIAGTGTTNVVAYLGNDDFTFGSGKTTVNASGALSNTYHFNAGSGGGTDVIQGFKVGTDHLLFQGVTVQSQTVSGGADNILLSDGTHVQLVGVGLLKTFG
jgi:hypothetical protein